MKPFDLRKAIAGDPIVTRDGRAAYFVAHVPELDKNCCVLVRVEDEPRVKDFSISGFYWGGAEHSKVDLFMAPKKRTVFVNLHKQRDTGEIMPFVYDDEALANRQRGSSGNCLGTFPIEIEE